MRRLKLFLENWGFHAFLLPVFFIVHNYKHYYGLVGMRVAINVGMTILLIAFILTLILLAATKNLNRTLQLVTLLGFVLLFYGVVKDFIQFSLHAALLAKYSVLIPILTITMIFLTRAIIKKSDFRRSNLFQNTLLLVVISIDVSQLAVTGYFLGIQKNLLVNSYPLQKTGLETHHNRPNVYYLLFDCYPGTAFLKDYMSFDNSKLDSSLKEKGFYVVQDPKSNYNRTAFSIASTLNFDYLQNLNNLSKPSPEEYSKALLTIGNARVLRIFKQNRYKFYNLSIFDFGNSHSIHKETFLTLPEKNILVYNTLVERFKRDLLWNFLSGKFSTQLLKNFFKKSNKSTIDDQLHKREFNNLIIDSVAKVSKEQTTSSKFIYAHFYLPHPPFFYKANGQSNNMSEVSVERSYRNKALFLSYLQYTNKKIIEICSNILKIDSTSLIILESDHGFTDFEGGPTETSLDFKNYIAFYFPDRNYTNLYDTLSNINTFPIIFNKYFDTNIPLQKDSSIFVTN